MASEKLLKEEHFTRRYNKLVEIWWENPYFSKDLSLLLKTLTRYLYRYREFFPHEELLDHFYRFLEHTDPKLLQYSFSEGQFKSKAWASEELNCLAQLPKEKVLIAGGWIGLMGQFLLQKSLAKQVISFDLDESIQESADLLNKPFVNEGWQFKAMTGDAFKLDYEKPEFSIENNKVFSFQADLIINTSCEHWDLKKWRALLPKNQWVLLQASNDQKPEDHLFPYESLEQFKESADLSEILYEGTLELRHSKRFMLIGKTS